MGVCGVGGGAAGEDSVEARVHGGVGDAAGIMMLPRDGGGGEVDAGAVRGTSLCLGRGREESEGDQAAAAGLSQQAWHGAVPHERAAERGVRSHRDAVPSDAMRGWMCVCVCMFVYLSVCIYMYIHTIYMYTYIHIPIHIYRLEQPRRSGRRRSRLVLQSTN